MFMTTMLVMYMIVTAIMMMVMAMIMSATRPIRRMFMVMMTHNRKQVYRRARRTHR